MPSNNKKAPWLIIVHGAPGTGKTTLSWALQKSLGGFVFEIGTLREIHLNPTWTNASRAEEAMSFKNFIYILRNYKANGYGPVIVTDLQDRRAADLAKAFTPRDYLLVTLAVSDPQAHKRRILDPKADRGFRRYDAAWAWNEAVMARPARTGELRLMTDRMDLNAEIRAVRRALRNPPASGSKPRGKEAYFDMDGFFESHPAPPWAKKAGRHLNEGWEKA